MNKLPLLFAAALLTACNTLQPLSYPIAIVTPAAETDPMRDRGDAADDPAIWVNPDDPGRSLILGTNKQTGLYVYDLAGREQQRLLVGRVNNVDLRDRLAVASNDEVNGLSWFRIDSDNEVVHIGNTAVGRIEPYGICLGSLEDGPAAAVTYKDGAVEFWRLVSGSPPAAELVRTVQLESQLEGCVFDEEQGLLFIGEESYGFWSIDLANLDAVPVAVDTVTSGNGLVADVEGISLYRDAGGAGFLVVSAQEADRFIVYERQPPHGLVGAFRIDATESIDAVTHTDGLDITSAALPGYPRGILVVQDDGNPRSGRNQNFKIVDWRDVAAAMARAGAAYQP